VFPCFSSLLGFISSLPNLLGTKDYVVVVVLCHQICLNYTCAIKYLSQLYHNLVSYYSIFFLGDRGRKGQ
jgi:hypothetical protein